MAMDTTETDRVRAKSDGNLSDRAKEARSGVGINPSIPANYESSAKAYAPIREVGSNSLQLGPIRVQKSRIYRAIPMIWRRKDN